jgi:hypothetical protein
VLGGETIMDNMTQEEINVSLFDELKRLRTVVNEKQAQVTKLEAENAQLKRWNASYISGLKEMEDIVLNATYCIDQERYESFKSLREKLKKEEAEKAEAVRIAVSYVKNDCNYCENEYGKGDCTGCPTYPDVQAIEKLTGKTWEEVSGEV